MQIPDIATKFTYKGSRFRVDGYMKAIPACPPALRPGEREEIAWEVIRESFLERHPDWNHEYRLVWCKKDEATHVSGYGVAGCIVAIDNPEAVFNNEYVEWPEERIQEAREHANWLAMLDDWSYPPMYIKGKYHE